MSGLIQQMNSYLSDMYLPKVHVIDIVEILLIAILLYYFIAWAKNTRAYALLKGILLVLGFVLIADLLKMNTILWIVKSLATVALTALVIVFQPELRKALEQLGEKNVVTSLLPFDSNREIPELFSDKTINELVRATYDMSEAKTGALIVIERNILLTEFEKTGIELDSVLTSQLLINIFEHNTPLHDGAVIVRGDRIIAATCYLPLSENLNVSKDLGTRHRAGLGISEVSDSLTIIVSEETGRVSLAMSGRLKTGVTPSQLREHLHNFQKRVKSETARQSKFKIWKGRDRA